MTGQIPCVGCQTFIEPAVRYCSFACREAAADRRRHLAAERSRRRRGTPLRAVQRRHPA